MRLFRLSGWSIRFTKPGGFKRLAQLGRLKKDVIWGLEVEAFTRSSVEFVLNLFHVLLCDG